MVNYVLPNKKRVNLTRVEERKFGKDGHKRLRESARHRSIRFDINKPEDLVYFWLSTPDQCFWCLRTLEQCQQLNDNIIKIQSKSIILNKLRNIIRTHNNKFLTYDRVDSDKGYSLDNLVKACIICNTAKGFLLDENEYEIVAPLLIGRIETLVNKEMI